MAIDDHLPTMIPSLTVSTSSSSSASSSSSFPFNTRQRPIQVATHNSSTFIQFPTNSRQVSPFLPIYRPRTSISLIRPSSLTTDTQSVSNQSKLSSNAPTSSIASSDHKRIHSHERFNPILNNPLLNHRKEQPKSFPFKNSTDSSHITRLCLSSKPLRNTQNDAQILRIRASTAPVLAYQTENPINLSDRLIISKENEQQKQQIQSFDKNKYDYITRWLNEVRQATYSTETFSKSKRSKN